jgi:transcriptional regulator with XRE-family HTH domain
MLLMSDRFTFALWMQSEREKRGWSQSDLSRYSGLHRAIISKIETNISTPSVETFIALAQAFKISPITIIRKAGLLPEGHLAKRHALQRHHHRSDLWESNRR